MVHSERSSPWSTLKTAFLRNTTAGGYTGLGFQSFTQARSPSGVKNCSALSALVSRSNDPSTATCPVGSLLCGDRNRDLGTIASTPIANSIVVISPPKENRLAQMGARRSVKKPGSFTSGPNKHSRHGGAGQGLVAIVAACRRNTYGAKV